jgi:flagellar hook-associated protein 2
MGSPPITFSGFNNIDFSLVLNAIMQQERRPLQALETRKQTLETADKSYATLATKLGALHSATTALSGSSSLIDYAATSNNAQAVAVTGSAGATPGRYDIVVTQLARAQVTASGIAAPDADTTVVATGGSLTIGGVAVTLTGPVTLSELAGAINQTADIGVSASVSETAPGAYRLVLRAAETGSANAFTLTSALTGSTVTFTDTNGNNIFGDTEADNAVQAADALFTVNNIGVTSTSNTVTTAIEGVRLDLLEENPTDTIVVTVARNDDDLTERLKTFVTAYNELAATADSALATTGSIGRDSLLRGVRNQLRNALTAEYGEDGYTRLAEVGLGFTRSGKLTLDEDALAEALAEDPAAVSTLFADATTGAFTEIEILVETYTLAGGLVSDARTRLTDEIARLGNRISVMEAQLAIRREALQREFIAADQAMSRLSSQSTALARLGAGLNGF